MDLAHGGGRLGWFASLPREAQIAFLALPRAEATIRERAKRGGRRGGRDRQGGTAHPIFGHLDAGIRWAIPVA